MYIYVLVENQGRSSSGKVWLGAIQEMTDQKLKTQQKSVLESGLKATLFCIVILGLSRVLLPRIWSFPSETIDRLAFAFQLNMFVFVWVVVGVRLVSRGRLRSESDISGSAYGPPSKALAIKAAFLQNTLEQSIIAGTRHVGIATIFKGPELSYLFGSVVLFGIGRILFYRGYSRGAPGRAFGMVTTMIPSIFGYLYGMLVLLGRIF